MEFNFEKLDVYSDAVTLASQVYEMTKLFPRDEVFGITNQFRRASISIASNIAEGSRRAAQDLSKNKRTKKLTEKVKRFSARRL
jgi:four helix bundle protein